MKTEKSRKSWFRQLMNGQVVVSDSKTNQGKEYEMKEREMNVAAEQNVKYKN